MTYKELFEEFKAVVPVDAVDYRPSIDDDTIVVSTKDGRSIVAKRIGDKKFEIQGSDSTGIHVTIDQIGKNASKILYIHDKEKLCDSERIWKMTEKGGSLSLDGGENWITF